MKKNIKKNGKVTNIFLSGVGGQGTILASNILAEVFLKAGFDVKKAEVHGMAQRGGDVTTHFRFGKKVYSPIIKYGDVDFLLSFELLESIRYINWVKPEGKIVINNQEIFPPAVNLGLAQYPQDVEKAFKKHFKENVHMINGQEIAKSLGNMQAANVVLVGAFSNFFPEIKDEQWIDALKTLLAPKLHDLNVKAFYEGKKAL
ncbi:MAG TPA: indolepyruvate oxidoreductase subunit beta [Syntrophorhabdaceae bacterium]|nr:indolepyruvate oxidoreductase subunit beta [Syntrophorhabdaceae bacterium]HNS14396.1 indolepyruvate oxidoreductase subunit beta [Syntrophorhabdaceae bacterium]HNT68113.1 indolepyruvate oxidoreductase subunit beta [Syntrophorhabdaceae bacterium]